MEMCAAAGSTLMMSPGFSLSPYPSLLWGGQSSLHQPRPTAPNRYQPPALSVDTLHMWRGKERKRQEGEMWIRWHHPMWKPSSLQWRHLQTLGSSSSVAAGDPNRRLAALHSTLRSTFSPHLYSMLLNFSFLSSLFFSPMRCSCWLLLLFTFHPPVLPHLLRIELGTLPRIKMDQWISSKYSRRRAALGCDWEVWTERRWYTSWISWGITIVTLQINVAQFRVYFLHNKCSTDFYTGKKKLY